MMEKQRITIVLLLLTLQVGVNYAANPHAAHKPMPIKIPELQIHCLNEGHVNMAGNSATCRCKNGFSGKFCEIRTFMYKLVLF
jgi:hypothetical protein